MHCNKLRINFCWHPWLSAECGCVDQVGVLGGKYWPKVEKWARIVMSDPQAFKTAQRTIDAERYKVRIRLTHRSIPTALCVFSQPVFVFLPLLHLHLYWPLPLSIVVPCLLFPPHSSLTTVFLHICWLHVSVLLVSPPSSRHFCLCFSVPLSVFCYCLHPNQLPLSLSNTLTHAHTYTHSHTHSLMDLLH